MKNVQGDVVAILDANGNKVVEYTYNAWGKLMSTTGSMASTLYEAKAFAIAEEDVLEDIIKNCIQKNTDENDTTGIIILITEKKEMCFINFK